MMVAMFPPLRINGVHIEDIRTYIEYEGAV